MIERHKKTDFDFDLFLKKYFDIEDHDFDVLLELNENKPQFYNEDFDTILPVVYPEKEECASIKNQFVQFLINEISQDLDMDDEINYHKLVNLYPMLAPKNMVKIF